MSFSPSSDGLPAQLQDALRSAWQALDQNPVGHLPLPARRAIYSALGPVENRGGAPAGAGYARHVELDKLAVQHVLPVWQGVHAGDDGPQRMLALADRVVRGEVEPQSARRERDRFSVDVENLRDADFAPGYVGSAAVAAAITAEVDNWTDRPPETTDDDLDPYEWDTSYYASSAYAGSMPGEPDDDAASQSRRREFWRWYLSEAVPSAYRAVPD